MKVFDFVFARSMWLRWLAISCVWMMSSALSCASCPTETGILIQLDTKKVTQIFYKKPIIHHPFGVPIVSLLWKKIPCQFSVMDNASIQLEYETNMALWCAIQQTFTVTVPTLVGPIKFWVQCHIFKGIWISNASVIHSFPLPVLAWWIG